VSLLAENHVLLLFVLLAVGTTLGAIRIKGVAVGPAAVLFSALAFSALDAKLSLPEVIGTFGLAIFAYTIGVTAGPSFFASLRSGLGPVAMVFTTLVGCGVAAFALGKALGFDPGTTAGLYAGSGTNTPGLAAAIVRLNGAPEPTVGYSITYIGGVVIMLAAAAWSLKKGEQDPTPDDEAKPSDVHNTTIKVTHDNVMSVRELTYTPYGRVLFSRYRDADGAIRMTDGDTVLRPGDRVLAIGPDDALRHITKQLGRRSKMALHLERTELDYRRIVLSRKQLFGRTVKDLGVWERFGARPTRVRRADQDFLATDDFVLQAGDRIRVAAPRDRMADVARYLGDSEHGTSDINPLGLALGLAIGLALGAVPIAMPGFGNLTLGSAAGPLIVGLVLGRIGRTGPVVWSLPHQASETLTQLGLLLFLAYAGGRAGSQFISAVRSPLGLKLVVAGIVLTAVHALALVLVGRRVLRAAGPRLAGFIAGSQTQPAVLAYANETTRFDPRVALGYALVYPVAMVTKILVSQILTML
jgi:putative transport protein